ncbi:unnamed protein product [Amoebophrya sp. A120]|nr:unnamed protein product [Amoebophrya sp. A120]|eukprot:GSA120T00022466001.1
MSDQQPPEFPGAPDPSTLRPIEVFHRSKGAASTTASNLYKPEEPDLAVQNAIKAHPAGYTTAGAEGHIERDMVSQLIGNELPDFKNDFSNVYTGKEKKPKKSKVKLVDVSPKVKKNSLASLAHDPAGMNVANHFEGIEQIGPEKMMLPGEKPLATSSAGGESSAGQQQAPQNQPVVPQKQKSKQEIEHEQVSYANYYQTHPLSTNDPFVKKSGDVSTLTAGAEHHLDRHLLSKMVGNELPTFENQFANMDPEKRRKFEKKLKKLKLVDPKGFSAEEKPKSYGTGGLASMAFDGGGMQQNYVSDHFKHVDTVHENELLKEVHHFEEIDVYAASTVGNKSGVSGRSGKSKSSSKSKKSATAGEKSNNKAGAKTGVDGATSPGTTPTPAPGAAPAGTAGSAEQMKPPSTTSPAQSKKVLPSKDSVFKEGADAGAGEKAMDEQGAVEEETVTGGPEDPPAGPAVTEQPPAADANTSQKQPQLDENQKKLPASWQKVLAKSTRAGTTGTAGQRRWQAAMKLVKADSKTASPSAGGAQSKQTAGAAGAGVEPTVLVPSPGVVAVPTESLLAQTQSASTPDNYANNFFMQPTPDSASPMKANYLLADKGALNSKDDDTKSLGGASKVSSSSSRFAALDAFRKSRRELAAVEERERQEKVKAAAAVAAGETGGDTAAAPPGVVEPAPVSTGEVPAAATSVAAGAEDPVVAAPVEEVPQEQATATPDAPSGVDPEAGAPAAPAPANKDEVVAEPLPVAAETDTPGAAPAVAVSADEVVVPLDDETAVATASAAPAKEVDETALVEPQPPVVPAPPDGAVAATAEDVAAHPDAAPVEPDNSAPVEQSVLQDIPAVMPVGQHEQPQVLEAEGEAAGGDDVVVEEEIVEEEPGVSAATEAVVESEDAPKEVPPADTAATPADAVESTTAAPGDPAPAPGEAEGAEETPAVPTDGGAEAADADAPTEGGTEGAAEPPVFEEPPVTAEQPEPAAPAVGEAETAAPAAEELSLPAVDDTFTGAVDEAAATTELPAEQTLLPPAEDTKEGSKQSARSGTGETEDVVVPPAEQVPEPTAEERAVMEGDAVAPPPVAAAAEAEADAGALQTAAQVEEPTGPTPAPEELPVQENSNTNPAIVIDSVSPEKILFSSTKNPSDLYPPANNDNPYESSFVESPDAVDGTVTNNQSQSLPSAGDMVSVTANEVSVVSQQQNNSTASAADFVTPANSKSVGNNLVFATPMDDQVVAEQAVQIVADSVDIPAPTTSMQEQQQAALDEIGSPPVLEEVLPADVVIEVDKVEADVKNEEVPVKKEKHRHRLAFEDDEDNGEQDEDGEEQQQNFVDGASVVPDERSKTKASFPEQEQELFLFDNVVKQNGLDLPQINGVALPVRTTTATAGPAVLEGEGESAAVDDTVLEEEDFIEGGDDDDAAAAYGDRNIGPPDNYIEGEGEAAGNDAEIDIEEDDDFEDENNAPEEQQQLLEPDTKQALPMKRERKLKKKKPSELKHDEEGHVFNPGLPGLNPHPITYDQRMVSDHYDQTVLRAHMTPGRRQLLHTHHEEIGKIPASVLQEPAPDIAKQAQLLYTLVLPLPMVLLLTEIAGLVLGLGSTYDFHLVPNLLFPLTSVGFMYADAFYNNQPYRNSTKHVEVAMIPFAAYVVIVSILTSPYIFNLETACSCEPYDKVNQFYPDGCRLATPKEAMFNSGTVAMCQFQHLLFNFARPIFFPVAGILLTFFVIIPFAVELSAQLFGRAAGKKMKWDEKLYQWVEEESSHTCFFGDTMTKAQWFSYFGRSPEDTKLLAPRELMKHAENANKKPATETDAFLEEKRLEKEERDLEAGLNAGAEGEITGAGETTTQNPNPAFDLDEAHEKLHYRAGICHRFRRKLLFIGAIVAFIALGITGRIVSKSVTIYNFLLKLRYWVAILEVVYLGMVLMATDQAEAEWYRLKMEVPAYGSTEDAYVEEETTEQEDQV